MGTLQQVTQTSVSYETFAENFSDIILTGVTHLSLKAKSLMLLGSVYND